MRGELERFVRRHPRLFVLTGAGVSTGSGIPDYRDAEGNWKRPRPVLYGDFVRDEGARRRYWARSMIGWRQFARARPCKAHAALARLEARGLVHQLVTQNVDRLHQRAGSLRVIDLHGRLDAVECLDCGQFGKRDELQRVLEENNPAFRVWRAESAPDGDALLEEIDLGAFRLPDCNRCAGTLKPSVVFFGESVPRERVQRALRKLEESDALLVVGSSLMVWSSYRFCRAATRHGKPIAAVNLGRTRADADLALKLRDECGSVLSALDERLG